MTERRIEYLPLDQLEPAETNPKAHDDAGIAASISRFGTIDVIATDDRTGRLISGHGRCDTYRRLRQDGAEPPDGVTVDADGRWLVPVVRGWSSADDQEAAAALVAVNRLVERGGWEPDTLVETLEQLRAADRLDAAVGYSSDDLDALLAELDQDPAPAADPEPEPEPGHQVAERVTAGEVWQLGRHRIVCGSSRDPEVVAELLAGAVVNVAVTSPPYADRRAYDEASGFRPVPPEEYVDWFEPVAAIVAEHLAPDGSWFVNIKAGAEGLDTELYVLDLVAAHVRRWGWHWLTEFCWERNGVPKQVVLRFKNQFEPVYQFTRGRPKVRPEHVRHRSDDAILPFGPGRGNTSWADPGSAVVSQGQRGDLFDGQRARKRRHGHRGGSPTEERGRDGLAGQGATSGQLEPGEYLGTGWAFPGNRLPTFAGTHEATGHTAAYPVGLPAWFIRAFSDEGDTVYDPFLGSGSTLLAAEQTGRTCYGAELSPAYCDVILDRWERHGGTPPVRLEPAEATT